MPARPSPSPADEPPQPAQAFDAVQRLREQVAGMLPKLPLATFPPVFVPEPNPETAILFILPRSKELLTSQDAQCLKYQTYLLFCYYPHRVVEHHEHHFSPSGQLPALLTTDGRLLAGNEIVDEARSKFDPEAKLSKEDRARMDAFAGLVESRLRFGLEYEFWYETDHFDQIVAPIAGAPYPWPLNFFLPRIERHRRIAWMLSKKPVLKTEEIFAETRQALQDLSTELGSQLYLMGSTPTFVDAALFAYLHTILSMLKSTQTESQLRNCVIDFDNLVKYSRRVWNTWSVMFI
ncbi:Metaxin-2 [Polyrhizophydium stewartii]|uniref:Metaxin-2 n=1 Tax=Polyrhizophydium stewartii TaxID=2732419 RepID=A0ABR4N9Q0_9FUNG|nr:Metaxin-2 [Polyrhizophydium stewartii]